MPVLARVEAELADTGTLVGVPIGICLHLEAKTARLGYVDPRFQVAASIYDACHYYRLLQNTNFGPYCGIVTSYEPVATTISKEPPNSDERYKFDTYTKHVLKKGQTTKQYEDEAKRRFIEEPANMKLLIVVSKLLTGFDAPTCTYIYLDN